MPVCHGSGGLAAQYAFGARSGASGILLGGLKVLFGLFGSSLALRWSAAFPTRVLGILLTLAGLELVKMGEGLNGKGALDLWVNEVNDEDGETSGDAAVVQSSRRFVEPSPDTCMRRYVVMMATVAASQGLKNAGLGFIVGFAVHLGYALQDWDARRTAAREGQIRLEGDG